jgi:hypothetical protein
MFCELLEKSLRRFLQRHAVLQNLDGDLAPTVHGTRIKLESPSCRVE